MKNFKGVINACLMKSSQFLSDIYRSVVDLASTIKLGFLWVANRPKWFVVMFRRYIYRQPVVILVVGTATVAGLFVFFILTFLLVGFSSFNAFLKLAEFSFLEALVKLKFFGLFIIILFQMLVKNQSRYLKSVGMAEKLLLSVIK